MRFKFAAVVTCGLSMLAAAASADTTLGWYVAADIGADNMDKQKLVVRDVTLVSREESGGSSSSSSSSSDLPQAAAMAALDEDAGVSGDYGLDTRAGAAAFIRAGNQLTPNWRVELEYGHRAGDVRDALIEGATGNLDTQGRGSLDLSSLMVNILYDIAPENRLHPYVGLGVGAVKVEADYEGGYADADYSEAYTIRSSRTVAAAQAVAGLAWAVSDRLNLDLTYRYLETERVDYRVRADTSYYQDYGGNEGEYYTFAAPVVAAVPAGAVLVEEVYDARMSGKIRDHSLTLGLRWSFGAPPARTAQLSSPPPTPWQAVAPQTYEAAPAPVVAPVAPPARSEFTVYFPFDSAVPTADGQAVIAAAAEAAASRPGAPVDVIGHADTSGSRAYNVRLSQNRAQMVADGLVRMGVPASVIRIGAAGETQPAVPTGDGVKNAENRRATIRIGS